MTKQATKTSAAAKPVKPVKAKTGQRAARAADKPKQTISASLIELMRSEGGKSAEELAQAVGWQKHSVRGFIAGTLKKRTDVEVLAVKTDGVTHYQVRDRASA